MIPFSHKSKMFIQRSTIKQISAGFNKFQKEKIPFAATTLLTRVLMVADVAVGINVVGCVTVVAVVPDNITLADATVVAFTNVVGAGVTT